VAQAAGEGSTESTITFLCDRLRYFRRSGGHIEFPPHRASDVQIWVEQAERFRRRFNDLPPADQTARLQSGLVDLYLALRSSICLVAILNAEVVAAISYTFKRTHILTGFIGSQQSDKAKKGGTALEVALATLAAVDRIGVRGSYNPPDARSYHVLIGRRLDKPAQGDSEWTADDCQRVAKRCGAEAL
jgi:hypothetical protein